MNTSALSMSSETRSNADLEGVGGVKKTFEDEQDSDAEVEQPTFDAKAKLKVKPQPLRNLRNAGVNTNAFKNVHNHLNDHRVQAFAKVDMQTAYKKKKLSATNTVSKKQLTIAPFSIDEDLGKLTQNDIQKLLMEDITSSIRPQKVDSMSKSPS